MFRESPKLKTWFPFPHAVTTAGIANADDNLLRNPRLGIDVTMFFLAFFAN
jgi:hypothetical protein